MDTAFCIDAESTYSTAQVMGPITDNSYIFQSKNDDFLGGAYQLAEWDRALGFSGPGNVAAIHHTTKVTNCKRKIKSHGNYKRSAEVYQYIERELSHTPNPQFSTLLLSSAAKRI